MSDLKDPKDFDSQAYGPVTLGTVNDADGNQRTLVSPYSDGSDAYANAGFVISFEHVPSETQIYFKAFITAFNETYNSDWQGESVYGRADPIYMFKQTQRKITLAFKVPAATRSEAYENLDKVGRLVQFLYPTYTSVQQAQTITQSPLIRLKVMNLLQNAGAATSEDTGETEANSNSMSETLTNYVSSNDASLGLLGAVNNITVNHNLEQPEAGVIEHANNTILPKMIEINLDFSPIHEHGLGWGEDKTFSNTLFPYGTTTPAAYSPDSETLIFTTDDDEDSTSYAELLGAAAAESAAEQAAMDAAEARYAGAFGLSRLADDAAAGDETAYQYAADAYLSGDMTDKEYERLQKKIEKKSE